VSDPAAELFKDSVMRLIAVARRVETAGRLANVVDEITTDVADWAVDTLGFIREGIACLPS
jgi:hypothetical protein